MTNDLSDMDVSQIDTSYPRIKPSTYELAIKSIELVENSAKTGDNIKTELATTSDSTSTAGEPVPAGFIIIHNISLVKTPKYDPNRSVAAFMKSAKITGSARSFVDNLGQALGKIVTAKVGIQKETQEYSERNTIKSFEVKA